MDPKSRRITNRLSGVAAVASFVTQPVPALDELIVVPMHYWLALRLAYARKTSPLALPWRPLQKIIWYGAGVRLVTNLSIGLVPVAGLFSNAITAIALTEYLARWLDHTITHPGEVPPDFTLNGIRFVFARDPGTTAEKPSTG